SSTADGSSFVITLYPDEAPITCENFEKLVKDGFYDGLKFHRVVDGFMAQGGDPSGDGTGGSSETIKGEFSQNGVENNLSHTRGVVSMARSNDPDSASSQFFICYGDESFLDGQYAAFGKVTEGMDVVDSFLKVERSLGSDGAQSSPNQDIVMEKVKMIDDDSDGNPRVEITMNDFLNE
ncbi:MAG: peptidylprolyl isomerase, partial [Ruminococcus callidus]